MSVVAPIVRGDWEASHMETVDYVVSFEVRGLHEWCLVAAADEDHAFAIASCWCARHFGAAAYAMTVRVIESPDI